MSSDTEKDLYKLIGSYENFSAQVFSQLQEVRKSLIAGDIRMSSIETTLASRGVCLVHQDIVARLEKMDVKDEGRDKSISEVQSDVRVVEYRINTKDIAKIATIAAGIAAPAIELIKWALTRTL